MLKVIKQFPVLSLLFAIALVAGVRAEGFEAPTVPAETNMGEEARIPYTATYYFYEAE